MEMEYWKLKKYNLIFYNQTVFDSLNPTDSLTIELPCQLIERIEKYAKENKTNITGVLIEALDNFLRKTY